MTTRTETSHEHAEHHGNEVVALLVRKQRWRGILLGLVVALAVLGVLNGWYLTMIHVDYEFSPGSELRKVCGAMTKHGCAVTTGRFGDVAGLPVSVIGLAGAAATAVVAEIARRHRAADRGPWRDLTFALTIVCLLASMLMGTFSFIERSFCPFCVAWYGINTTMALCAFGAWRSGQRSTMRTLTTSALGRSGIVATAVFVTGLAIGQWGYVQRRAATLDKIAEAVLERVLRDERPVSLDLEGLPSTGPEDAVLTVVELIDFECPFCRDLWIAFDAYRQKTSFPVRTVFVHYPVDSACNAGVEGLHLGACVTAVAAECARRYDAFFEYGDLLFQNQFAHRRDDLVTYATQLGMPEQEFSACLDDPATEQTVRESIARAKSMGIQTTPTFFVNGYRFSGAREAQWIQLVFDGLAHAQQRTKHDER